jgi:hypothetical protein
MGFVKDLADSHRRLKQRVHNTRIPLGPKGRLAMGVFYLVGPVVAGCVRLWFTWG